MNARRNSAKPKPGRSPEECQIELSNIDQAHIQNEAGRDAFLALAHTALFAASIAFIGSLSEAAEADWRWLLVSAWSSNVVGLISLTFSFHAAGSHIARRRQQIYDDNADRPTWAALLNAVALWSFPVALISTFAFAVLNILA